MASAAAFFSFFSPQLRSDFDRTFGLGDCGLGGRLSVDGRFGLVSRSTVGLVGFRHGGRRVMKDVGGC